MADLLGRRNGGRVRPVLRNLFLAAQRQRVIQAILAIVAALPRLPGALLMSARTQGWLVRVVSARTQVVLALVRPRHSVANGVVTLLNSAVLGILLPSLPLLGVVAPPFELEGLVGLGRGGLRVDALQAAGLVGRAERQFRRCIAVAYRAVGDVALVGHRDRSGLRLRPALHVLLPLVAARPLDALACGVACVLRLLAARGACR